MKITVIGRKCTLRDSFKDRTEKRLEKLDKFFESDAEAKVTATVEKSSRVVEITIFQGGIFYRARERAENMNEALEKCVDSLVRQIRKNKTKVEKKLRQEAFIPYEMFDDIEEDYRIVREKTIPIKPQTVDEAILRMNLLSHRFYMFINADNGKPCVVYARNDGGYGLLVPED